LLPLYSSAHEDRADSLLGSYPNPARTVEALQILVDTMFPGKMSPGAIESEEVGIFLTRRLSHAWRLLRPEIESALPFRWQGEAARMEGAPTPCDARAESFSIMQAFLDRLPEVRKLLVEDVKAAYEGDPAALTYAEVQLAYPGILAITSHRLAHELYRLKVPIVPRIMSEWTHAHTGVDIHPGARIGHGFFVDHATGVVIGETTEIGNRVKVYQGVTLGARSFPLDENGNPIKHIKRHPTVEDEVVIYANATILGGDTVIGRGSTIGGNVFLMESVPPNTFVANEHPELRIKTSGQSENEGD
jgi:serine O-acetyltransferase